MKTRNGRKRTTSNNICRFDDKEISNRSLESPSSTPGGLKGKEAHEVVRRFWPRSRGFRWSGRCFSFLGQRLRTLGENTTENGSKSSVHCDTKTHVFCDEEMKQKKRALTEFLTQQQNETKDVSEFLQGSEFTMTEFQNRRKLLTELQAYDQLVRKAPKDVQSKKKKHKKSNSKKEGLESGTLVINGSRTTKSLHHEASKGPVHHQDRSKQVVKIKDLIESGLLTPGEDLVSVIYKGTTYFASLDNSGTILFQGSSFNSPTAFSIHVKRILSPEKRGDDGWNSVMISGQSLSNWRSQYLNTSLNPSPKD